MTQKYLRAQEKTGSSGVAAISVAQEFQNVFTANIRTGHTNGVSSRLRRPTGG